MRYKKEIELRKKLHNELVELKGNIRVFCRVRPVIKEDGTDFEKAVTFAEDEDDKLFIKSKGSNKTFEMDRVFNPDASQKQVSLPSPIFNSPLSHGLYIPWNLIPKSKIKSWVWPENDDNRFCY